MRAEADSAKAKADAAKARSEIMGEKSGDSDTVAALLKEVKGEKKKTVDVSLDDLSL